jgi:DNA-3-methyladenine glycosylase I
VDPVTINETAGAALAAGPDGRQRCWWSAGTPEYVRYHDEEWGRPVLDDRLFFEHLCLETFQSGLSWITVLRKRPAFRAAFAEFDPAAVAVYGEADVERLLADAGIVRNRRKIDAVIANAGAALELIAEHGSLAGFFREFVDGAAGGEGAGGGASAGGAAAAGAVGGTTSRVLRSRADIPAATDTSAALAAELKRRGWRFLGPTTVYAHLQACGLVNDHVDGCCVRDEVQRLQEEAGRVLHLQRKTHRAARPPRDVREGTAAGT